MNLHCNFALQFLTQSSERENAAEPAMYYISILMQKIQNKYSASHSFASSWLLLPICNKSAQIHKDRICNIHPTLTVPSSFVAGTHHSVLSWFTCCIDFIKALLKKSFKTQSQDLVFKLSHRYCMHNIDLYSLKCTSGETLSLSGISLFISPFGYISGHVKSYACLQCAVCQGSGSNWLTSCSYFTCLSLFLHSFPKPWHDSRATAAFAGEKKLEKRLLLCTKVQFFFLFLFGWGKLHRVIKCLCCLYAEVRKFLPLGENMAIDFSFPVPSQTIWVH